MYIDPLPCCRVLLGGEKSYPCTSLHQRALVREVYAAVQTGRLVVVAGLVGSGKTHLLTRIEQELGRSNRIAVAKSLAADKRCTSLPLLIAEENEEALLRQRPAT